MRRAIVLAVLVSTLTAAACGGSGSDARPTGTVEQPTPTPGIESPTAVSTANEALALYTNTVFKVQLTYPASWQPDPNYGSNAGGIPEAYSDPRGRAFGYFHVNALCCPSDLDASAQNEASHKLKPYGDNPIIEALTVDGRDARLILADEATAPEPFMAELVVPYRTPVRINSPNPYTFFIMYAHKDYIRTIAESARLLQ